MPAIKRSWERLEAQPYKRSASLDRDQRKGGPVRLSKPKNNLANKIILTNDQQTALDALIEFEQSEDLFFLLSGYAGTGKSTVLQHYVEQSNVDVLLTAPTNKAVRVLRDMAGNHGLEVPCMTIFRALNLRLQTDAREKYVRQARTNEPAIASYDVVIVDECSMVGNRTPFEARGSEGLYDQIISEAEYYNTKIVFVGDPAQLPPVKEGESPSFATPQRFELTKVVRQAEDSAIIRLATFLRSRMYGGQPGIPELGEGVTTWKSAETYDQKVVEAFLEDPDHPTKVKALAWRNRTVDALNARIREAVHGKNPEPYIIGERYVATQPVVEVRGSVAAIALATDEDAVIAAREDATHPRYREYEAIRLDMTSDEADFSCLVLHPNSQRQWERDLNELARDARRNKRLWRTYWEMHDGFAHFKPHYAMTVHRSQGSTYENVFVDAVDITANPNIWEAQRCLYVACTRASRNLFVLE